MKVFFGCALLLVSSTAFAGDPVISLQAGIDKYGSGGGAAIGGGASIGYSLGLSASGASLDGSASTWMTGSASAGLGVPLLNLALRSDLQLGTTTLQAGVQVTPSVLSGRADLVFDPVKIDLGLAVQSGGKVLYRQDLASYSASSKNTNLVRF